MFQSLNEFITSDPFSELAIKNPEKLNMDDICYVPENSTGTVAQAHQKLYAYYINSGSK